ncbi:dipeptide ABC transporter ATP-binding protein [Frondihabitans australicus]|uniref:Peptide/nickel transport system ATP-binding protein n=1 Tax=Frondihabitans australicus TaxID=386892 RepID=A0A495IG29_9MICO|nr:ABC transporter ATP-binding protein [Frondihabitans australicus]RKR74610.1 peptide/nickel transport system ATP-binding protein [Frondihabitans australicus]
MNGSTLDGGPTKGVVVDGLSVSFGGAAVVQGVSFTLAPGECVALVGESGSGKSVTARALLGLTGGQVSASALSLDGRSLLGLRERAWRRIRGPRVGLVLQDALVSLDPLRPIGREIDDALRLHTRLSPAERRARVIEVLEEVGMPSPAERRGQRSGELSGGLRQRALIAAALALRPDVIIADEPTTALDAAVQRQVTDRLGVLRDEGAAVLAISHDLGAVRRLADRVVVMRAGRVVETGPTEVVLDSPREEYTRALVAALPAGKARGTRLSVAGTVHGSGRHGESPPESNGFAAPDPHREPILTAQSLTRRFGERVAVDDVSLDLRRGETLGLVGASGSGKTTTARLLLGLETPDAGSVTLDGAPWNPLRERDRRPRRSRLGAVYQDALSSFDPRLTVGRTLVDALTAGATLRMGTHRDEVTRLLDEVGLPPEVADRSPATLSGGQRQRVAIARALAPSPAVLICDEPVSSLDVTVQAQVLDLLDELQERLGLAYLFISHDLDVIRHQSDRVAVMHEGRIVEEGATERVFTAPAHPYTKGLLAAASSPRG